MKKYFSLLMCFALVSFVACDGGSDPNDDGPDGTPPDGTRLVEKIFQTYEETYGVDVYSGTAEYSFTYDAKNRVTKIEITADEMEEDEYLNITISYGTGTITVITKEGWWGGKGDVDPGEVEVVRAKGFFKDRRPAGIVSKTRSESENDVFVEEIGTFTYTLNADGYFSTGTSEWKESNAITESGTIAFTYNNGFIGNCTYEVENHENEYTSTSTTDYTWSSNGNLTKAVEEHTYNDNEYESEFIMTYGAAVNPTGVNIDMNFWVCPAIGDDFLCAFGFYGKSSKNLLSAYETEWSEATVKWETDTDGFVTKATREEIEDSGWESKSTYTITYKK